MKEDETIKGHWFYYLKCEMCKTVNMVAGPKRENTEWEEFFDILLRSSEARTQFRYCEVCGLHTKSILIAFDSKERKTTH